MILMIAKPEGYTIQDIITELSYSRTLVKAGNFEDKDDIVQLLDRLIWMYSSAAPVANRVEQKKIDDCYNLIYKGKIKDAESAISNIERTYDRKWCDSIFELKLLLREYKLFKECSTNDVADD